MPTLFTFRSYIQIKSVFAGSPERDPAPRAKSTAFSYVVKFQQTHRRVLSERPCGNRNYYPIT